MKENTLSYLLYLSIIAIMAILLRKFVCFRTKVSGNSMWPNLADGDQLLVEKISYRFRKPRRFDIIVFPMKRGNANYIKRIIATPGETVQIKSGYIYINDLRLQESFGYQQINRPGKAKRKILLKENEYFVLGDNRNDSMDSRDREVGVVHSRKILGRVWFCLWSFAKKREYKR